jgi:hypothetical protein
MIDKDAIKKFSHASDNPRIEVLRYSAASRTMLPYSFWLSEIEHIEGTGDDKSLLVLKSNLNITLELPFAELAAKIDEGYSPLDLKAYSKVFVPERKIGEKMEDGTVYAGISPDTKKAMYAMPQDLPLLTFNEAAILAEKIAPGDNRFRIPTLGELKVLFNNRSALGGFNSADPLHWSSTPSHFSAGSTKILDFTGGGEGTSLKHTNTLSVRFVRD